MDYSELPSYKKDFLRSYSAAGTRADAKSFGASTQKTTTQDKPKLGLLTKTTATNDIWDATAYSKPEWRSYLNQTFYKKEFGSRQHELSTQVNREEKKFNRKRSRISEYSNALYNSRVFLNPSFTSC